MKFKDAGRDAEFNRWWVELAIKILTIIMSVGVSYFVLTKSFDQQRMLLDTNLNAQRHNVDTSLYEQSRNVEKSLKAQSIALNRTIKTQQRLLDSSLRGQIKNQRSLDRARLIGLLMQMGSEIQNNLEHLTSPLSNATGRMRLAIDYQDSTGFTATIPQFRFSTSMWEVAKSKDYFILHNPPSVRNLSELYRAFNQFNTDAHEFENQVSRLYSILETSKVRSVAFQNGFRRAQALERHCESTLAQLPELSNAVMKMLNKDIEGLLAAPE